MVRSFQTHEIRRQEELGGLWQFSPLDEAGAAGASMQVAVPSCWESYPGYAGYRGRAAYETAFTGGGHLRVVCKGVSHTAQVFLDGEEIAAHYNAYTAFSGIALRTQQGEHQLKIIADNRFSEASALHVPNDYMSYGGISRPVLVEQLPDIYLDTLHCTPRYDGAQWLLDVSASLCSLTREQAELTLCIEVAGAQARIQGRFAAGEERLSLSATLSVPNAKPYSPDAPALYLVRATLRVNGEAEPSDDLIERVGFREIAVQGKQILYNGEPLHIKGFCRHEDHPQFGCALPLPAMDYDLNLLKDLGANAVRTSHYPNDELFLDLCDEKGFLVWEENHARGLNEAQMQNPNFRRQCHDCIDEMIAQHFNHPSIIIWGILNECASETEYGRDCFSEQLAQIKALDPSRPTSFASCKFFNDICLDLPDIVSYNIYPQWYHDDPADAYLVRLYNWVQNTGGAGKPFLITEIGAGAIYGVHSPARDKWSEERQADILRDQLTAVLSKAECSGVFIWQFCDVRISAEWFDNRPRTMNNKGVVDEYRRPKMSYPVVKELFSTFE